MQEVVRPSCSKAENKGVEVGVLDRCVLRLTVMRDVHAVRDLQLTRAFLLTIKLLFP